MKHPGKRHILLRLTALLLAFSTGIGSALASDALGWELHAAHRPLSEGSALTTGWFWSDTYSDLRTERYVTYIPNLEVKPTVSYGDTILQKSTLETMAKTLETAGKRVVGGSNGDFYVVATGSPLGMVVSGGILRSSSSYHYAVGFRADGSAFVGRPTLKIAANLPDGPMSLIGGLNKVRTLTANDGGATLLNEEFASTTRNTTAGVDVYLTPLSGGEGTQIPASQTPVWENLTVSSQPKIGSRMRFQVSFLTEASGANPIYPGSYVLTADARESPEMLARLRALQPGQEISIDIASADPRWNEAEEAIGGMFHLLEHGELGSGLQQNGGSQQTARTAIGIKADGTVLFYTIDGKQKGLSVGATCTQVAMRLRELGCVDAIGLDGGGSTTLGVTYPDANAMEVVNSPADGAQRAVSNAVFLTTELRPTGTPMSLDLQPGDAVLLSGMCLNLTARTVDTHWYDMGTAEGVAYAAAGAGTITPEGQFTASGSGQALITGTLGDLTGSANVTVVDTPTQFSIVNEADGGTASALQLKAGETAALRAVSSWKGLPLPSQDEAYRWSCDPNIGTISADGTFTAGTTGGSGTILAAAGQAWAAIPVTVTAEAPAPPTPSAPPAVLETPVPSESLAPSVSPAPSESSMPLESPAPSVSPAPSEPPMSSVSPAPSEPPAPSVSPAPLESPAPSEPPVEQGYFQDMTDHWAAPYANQLYEMGVTNGAGQENGALLYLPENEITRAEFFTMTARWLRLDLSQYADVALPFIDVPSIPDWAVSAVRAMYAEGIVAGSREWDGLYVNPNASISRAEAMTILGRTQERDGEPVSLDLFSDASDVPAWAEEHVRTLVALGVIGGYEDGTLRPGAPLSRGQAAKVFCTLR